MHMVVILFLWEVSSADTCRVAELLPQVGASEILIAEAEQHCHRMGQIAWHREHADECESCTYEFRKLIRKGLSGEQLAELERLFIIRRGYHIFLNDEMQRRLQIDDEQGREIAEGALQLSRHRPGLFHPQNLAFDDVILHEVIYLRLTEWQRQKYKKMIREPRRGQKPTLTPNLNAP